MMQSRVQRGFTLVELLVVIAIIGILIALLLPAVQAAREAARRTQCNNNMKQIGLALHNYHDNFRSFPPGVIWGVPNKPEYELGYLPPPFHHTWNTFILPFLEQQPLYDTVDFDLPAYGQSGGPSQAVVGTLLETMMCPSDNGFRQASENHDIAWTCYPGSEGFHWWPDAYLGNWSPWDSYGFTTTADFAGVFATSKTNRVADVTDGLSNTIFAAEKDSLGYYGGPWRTCGSGMPRIKPWAVNSSAFVGTSISGWGTDEGGTTRFSEVDGSGPKSNGAWFPPPAPHHFTPTYIAYCGPNSDWPGPSSKHPGGVNTLLGDGSVRWVSETIVWKLWIIVNGIGDQYVAGEF